MRKSKARTNVIWSIVMTIICVIYMYPIFMVLMNSLKVESAISTSTAFQLPNSETFAGFDNYVNAITARGFFASFGYTLFITVSSVAAILLHVRLVYNQGQELGHQGAVPAVRLLHGRALPDGHVHAVLSGRQHEDKLL